ncbi:replication-associated protein [Trichonephila clavipes]|nr:replication-associated protein [Trichonephila clavipes]
MNLNVLEEDKNYIISVLQDLNIGGDQIISIPRLITFLDLPCKIYTNRFKFQDKNLPIPAISVLFDETVEREFQKFFIIATDASKNVTKLHRSRKDREDRSGGGLLIAVPSNISAQQIPIQIQQTRELEILAIKIHVRNISFYIVNIYAPRGFNIILIKSFLESLMAPMIIFGDFNLHHPMWGSDHISRYSDEFVEWITDSNLVLLNTTVPTYRSSADATSLLDLTFLFFKHIWILQ